MLMNYLSFYWLVYINWLPYSWEPARAAIVQEQALIVEAHLLWVRYLSARGEDWPYLDIRQNWHSSYNCCRKRNIGLSTLYTASHAREPVRVDGFAIQQTKNKCYNKPCHGTRINSTFNIQVRHGWPVESACRSPSSSSDASCCAANFVLVQRPNLPRHQAVAQHSTGPHHLSYLNFEGSNMTELAG